MKEQRVKRQRKTKKIIFNSKKEFVRVYSFMTSPKSLKFEPTLPPPPPPEVSGWKHIYRVRKIPCPQNTLDVILYRHEVQIRSKLIYLDFIFMLHYEHRITQVWFNLISMDSDYDNAVFMQCFCLWTVNNALIFAVFFSRFL